jgi:hypothetical protein
MIRALLPWLVLAGACRPDPIEVGPPSVVVLVMDGVRSEESFGDQVSSATGNLPAEDTMVGSWGVLVPQAARATDTWNIEATITAPAHAAMVSGRRQPLANYAPNEGPGLYVPELPGLVQALHEIGVDGSQIQFIGNTEHLAPLVDTLWPGDAEQQGTYVFVAETDPDVVDDTGNADLAVIPASTDAEVFEAVKSALKDDGARLVVANLHRVDRAGHWGSEDSYPLAVKEIDNQLPGFWKFVQARDNYANNTWVIVVSDHGRHQDIDDGDPPPWRHHGDSCTGCRHVPLLVLGPGVNQGLTSDVPVLHEDLAPTIAALMGARVPWAEGRVLHELFTTPLLGPQRTGVADVAAAGGHVAELTYLDDPWHRTELRLDGELVSDPDAIVVEEPVMAADGDRAWLCWREVTVDLGASASPWLGRCLATEDGASWQDIGFPEDIVGPYWEGWLTPLPGGVALAYPDNPNAITTPGLDGDEVGMTLATWDGAAWGRASAGEDISFPTDPHVAVVGSELLVSVAGGLGGDDSRHTRRVFTWHVGQDGSEWTFDMGFEFLLEELNPGERWRTEYPVMRFDGSSYLGVAIGYSEGYTAIVAAESADAAQWAGARVVEAPGPAVPHLAPRWVGDTLVFAVVDADEQIQICGTQDARTSTCVAAGSTRISQLTGDGDGVLAIVDVGTGQWELAEIPLSELGG